ncbi:hypothetical protein ACHHYP_07932 [Achlya hypogyna]|uniref:N-acetyltransferase domain-containing protein n=1 Tax=Achlya hypogyna TaxID=1202772 RepID=A0A1V9YQ67_ACHHY|nr:hypothetical protein ACHHYP_07932 [Achlya hypogyna]
MLDIVEIPTKALFLERTKSLQPSVQLTTTDTTASKSTWWFVLVNDATDLPVAYAILSATEGLLLSPNMVSEHASALGQYVALHRISPFPTIIGDTASVHGFADGYEWATPQLALPPWLYRLRLETRLLRVAALEASNQIACITLQAGDIGTWWFVLSESESSDVTSYAVLSTRRGIFLSPYMPPEAAVTLARYLTDRSFTAYHEVRGTHESVIAFAKEYEQAAPHHTSAQCAQIDWLYRLDRVRPPPATVGALKLATDAEAGLLTEWYRIFVRECFQADIPDAAAAEFVRHGVQRKALFLWVVGGAPVGFAGFAPPVTTDSMTVYMLGPIFVSSSERRKGYSKGLTAALSATVLDLSTTLHASVMLFADSQNIASNKAYQAVGFLQQEQVVTYSLI